MKETRDDYPFGLPLPQRYDEAPPPTREDYTGHERDAASGLHYAGKPNYMAALGRRNGRDLVSVAHPSGCSVGGEDAAVGYRSVRSKSSASGFKKVTPSTVAPVEKSLLSTVGIWFSFAAAQIWASK